MIFHRLSSSRASDYVFDEAIKTFFMTIDMCLRHNGPRDGAIFLFDMKSVGLLHLWRVNLSSIRKFFHYVQECVPGKLRAIHVMNVVPFMDKIMALIKPFVKADILKNVNNFLMSFQGVVHWGIIFLNNNFYLKYFFTASESPLLMFLTPSEPPPEIF